MSELPTLLRPDKGEAAIAIALVDKAGFDDWLASQPERARRAIRAQGFKGEPHQIAHLACDGDSTVVLGVSDRAQLGPWCLAKAAESLAEGAYRIAESGPGAAALGWLVGQYRFDRYKKDKDRAGPRILLSSEPARIDEMLMLAEATCLVRDLINIPASDMGPAELEAAVSECARDSGATIRVTSGKELEREFPMIAAVGRAAAPDRGPRLIELVWGNPEHRRLALIGKGVCFDTGGLDIKPSPAMRLMKKDMGGAAHAIALAGMIMRKRLPVRLHLLIPAVENAIAGTAFRPGDIISSRQGLTVEVGNTDAEGRLILADALTRAAEDAPALILDFATLTGAARVALGPDLPALFSNDDELATSLALAAEAVDDPVWRLPLWPFYQDMLNSDVADIGNVSEGGMAGAITAALFLQKFVPDDTVWAHFDTFAWRSAARPGRPKGGDALGLRTSWAMISERFSA